MAERQTRQSIWNRVVGVESGCWEWTGYCTQAGYGMAWWAGERYLIHRLVAWWFGIVKNPRSKRGTKVMVRHLCHNKKCCNPAHLVEGTASENNRDTTRDGVPKDKLSDAQANDIRACCASGETQAAVGALYGVSQAAVSKIVRMKSHV